MKRFLALICFCLGVAGVYAEGFTAEQETLRTQIKTYLDTHGYSATKQDDGLMFKADGATYYIEIDKKNKKPFYVKFCRYVKYGDSVEREDVANNIKDCNATFGVKVCCLYRSVVLSAEMYISKASEFTSIFDTCLSQLKSAYLDITQ